MIDEAYRARARILIVDDDDANLRLMVRLLTSEGFRELKTLADPRETVATFDAFQPDLVVLDLAMPHLDGVEVLELLAPRRAAAGYLPVLVLTGDSTRDARERALRAGATEFLTKPVEAVETSLRIEHLLETRSLHLALRSENRRLEERVIERSRALDAISSRIAILDEHGTILEVNDAWRRFAPPGRPAGSLGVGDAYFTPCEEEPDPVAALLVQGAIRDLLAGKRQRLHIEYPLTANDCSMWFSLNVTSFSDESGVRAVVAHEDITERKRLEEVQRVHERSETESRTKSALLANLSHELRTPLNSILGFTQVLEEQSFGPLNERQLAYLRYVMQAGNHMLSLVAQLLDLRRAEEGALELELTETPIDAVLADALPLVARALAEGGHDVRMAVTPGTVARADRRLLLQVLVNLLSNAAKYTGHGGVIVARAAPAGANVEIHIEDNGVGIGEADLPRVFDYFVQVGGKHTHHMKGSGVGLALSKKLVEAMGGALTARSTLGAGSTFSITLPRGETR